MKYGKILLMLALAALACSCEEKLSEREILDNRVKECQKLEVKFLLNGSEVQTLAFSHHAVKATVDVEINNDALKWDIVSDKNWCTVEKEEHCGPGSVVISLTANDGFEAREPATLTFQAGQYRGTTIEVRQSASAFVLSQPYFVCDKNGGSLNMNVSTVTGTSWEISGGGWVTASKGTPADAGGMTVTPVTLTVAANEGGAKFGGITLTAGEETDMVYVYQFGNNVEYDGAGNIFWGRDAASFSFIAPGSVVKSIELPDFAEKTIEPQEDGTDLITITLAQNISDTNAPREVPITLSLNNTSETKVVLPAMKQDFTPSHGLNSANGLKALAKVIEEGGSTEPWEKDGVITVLGDINMAGVTDWAGIGSDGHPFSGKFDGGGKSVLNLRGSKPLFNVCKNAEISNLTMDPLCDLTVSTGSVIGAMAATAEGTTFTNCSFDGKLTVDVPSGSAVIGGLVGVADATTVLSHCIVGATITINTPTLTSASIGGVIGLTYGTVSDCEMKGMLAITACPGTVRAGGITSSLTSTTTVSGNSFRGDVNLEGTTGTNVRLGGLYGSLDGGNRVFDYSTDKTEMSGSISIAGFGSAAATLLYAGGLIGYIDSGIALTVKGYSCSTIISVDHSAVARKGNWFCYGGVLGGCNPDTAAGTMVFENITKEGPINNKYATGTAVQIKRMCLGGIAGHINGPVTFKDCHNLAEVGAKSGGDYCAKSNGYSQEVGGIAGLCYGGNAVFENCENKANISNLHYNNNPILFILNDAGSQAYYTSSDAPAFFTACATGGILGAYSYNHKPDDGTLTMTSCTSKGVIDAYRGSAGGIVGYAYNATIEGCEWTGSSVWTLQDKNGTPANNQASDKGGIAGVLAKSSVSNCTAAGNITSICMGSAESSNVGGIVAYAALAGPVTVTGCSYDGVLANGIIQAAKPGVFGGVLGRNDVEGTTLTNNKFKGTVDGQAVTTSNVESLATSHFDQTESNMNKFFSKMKAVTVSGTTLL